MIQIVEPGQHAIRTYLGGILTCPEGVPLDFYQNASGDYFVSLRGLTQALGYKGCGHAINVTVIKRTGVVDTATGRALENLNIKVYKAYKTNVHACAINAGDVSTFLEEFATAKPSKKCSATIRAQSRAISLLSWWNSTAVPFLAEYRAEPTNAPPTLFDTETEDTAMNNVTTVKDFLESFRANPDNFRAAIVAAIEFARLNNLNLGELIAFAKFFHRD